MAVINFFESTLSETSEAKEYEEGTLLKDAVEEYVNSLPEKQYVEVYFPDTDTTEMVPIEDDGEVEVLAIVNGTENKDLDYTLQPDDIVNVYVMQRDNKSGALGIGIAGIGIAVISAIAAFALGPGGVAVGAAFGLSAKAMTSLAIGAAWLGMATGVGMAIAGFTTYNQLDEKGIEEGGGERKNLYAINGSNNEDILGKKYPLILGKSLVNPYIVGSPYHVTYNSIPGEEGKDETFDGEGTWKDFSMDSSVLSNLKTDHADHGQYFKALYCVGYGPLKLTDFRIGETKLAYNRTIDSDGIDKMVARIRELQAGGNVNLLNRQVISASELSNKGWDVNPGNYATVYTTPYPNSGSGHSKYIGITPIVMDDSGKLVKVMTPEEWTTYAASVYETGNDPLKCKLGKTYEVNQYDSEIACIEAMNADFEEIHNLSDLYTTKCLYSTVLHGILDGYDDKYDAGDILSKWKNNDVQLEILQAGDLIGGPNKWSSIYPVTVKEDPIDASILFAYDASLSDIASVTYKGVAVPNGYRTNTVRFSKSCPYRIEVELDMPGGMYMTNTITEDSVSKTKYRQIPLFVAVQWRFASSDEASSDPNSSLGWETFDCEILHDRSGALLKKYPVVYNDSIRNNEISHNKGLSSLSAIHNENWVKEKAHVFELSHGMSDDKTVWNSIEVTETVLEEWKNLGLIEFEKVNDVVPYSSYTTTPPYGQGPTITEYSIGARIPALPGITRTDGGSFGPYSDNFVRKFSYYNVRAGSKFDEKNYRIDVQSVSFWIKEGDSYLYRTIQVPVALQEKGVDFSDNTYTKDTFNINERRFVFAKDFTPDEVFQLINSKAKQSVYYDQIEVRVIRLTPCYLNQSESGVEDVSPMQYEDLIKWTYMRTWTFDKDAYTEAVNIALDNKVSTATVIPSKYPERPIPAEDLNKFCYVALSLKQDVAETGGSSLEKFNCIASSYAPKFDMIKKLWAPVKIGNDIKELELKESYNYYYIHHDSRGIKVYKKLPIIPQMSAEDASLFTQLGFNSIPDADKYTAKGQYDYGIEHYRSDQFFYKRAGTDYTDRVRDQVFDNKIKNFTYRSYPYMFNNKYESLLDIDVPTYLVTRETALRFETQNSAAVALYSLIGNHLKNEAKTFDAVELGPLADMYEFCNDVVDGTLENYTSPRISYTTADAAIWESTFNSHTTISAPYLNKLIKAPVNAVWKGCYDYLIDPLMVDLGLPEYNKQSLVKWMEDKKMFGASDGKLHIQYRCNGVVTSEVKLETLFSNILVTGRSSYKRSDNNKYEVLIGQKNPYPVNVINQRNCISKNNTRNFEETLSGLQVSYIDENDNYETNSFYVMDDGEDYKAPTKRVEKFQLNYVTNAAQIRSLSRFNLACTLYQKESYSRTVGYMGYSLSLGDMVLLQDDSLLIGTDKGGRIAELIFDEGSKTIVGFITDEPFNYYNETDETGLCKLGCTVVQPNKYGNSRCVTLRFANTAKLAETAQRATEFKEGETYYVYNSGSPNNKYTKANPQPTSKNFSAKDYYINYQTYKMAPGLTNRVILQNPITVGTPQNGYTGSSLDATIDGTYYVYNPEVGNLVAFGYVGSITSKAIIMAIKPKDKGQFDLSLVPYNDDLYNYGEKLPYFKSNLTTPKREKTEFGFDDFPSTAEREEDKSKEANRIQDILTRDMIVGYDSWYTTTADTTVPDITVDAKTGIPTYKGWTKDIKTAQQTYNEMNPYLWTGTVFKYSNGTYDITMEVSVAHYGQKGDAGNDYRLDLTQEVFNLLANDDGSCYQQTITTHAYVVKDLSYVKITRLKIENDTSTGTVDITDQVIIKDVELAEGSEKHPVKAIQIPTKLFEEEYTDMIITAYVEEEGVMRVRLCKLTAMKVHGVKFLDFTLDHSSIKVNKKQEVYPETITPQKFYQTSTGSYDTEDGFIMIQELPDGVARYCGYFEVSKTYSDKVKYKQLLRPRGIYGFTDDGNTDFSRLCGDVENGELRVWIFYDRETQ